MLKRARLLCYTEKAAPTRHRPERLHNARANRRKQCSPNETKPYSKPTLPRKRLLLLCSCCCVGTMHPHISARSMVSRNNDRYGSTCRPVESFPDRGGVYRSASLRYPPSEPTGRRSIHGPQSSQHRRWLFLREVPAGVRSKRSQQACIRRG